MLHHHYPVLLATADAVEFVFKVAGEGVVHVLREELHQEVADNLAGVRGCEATAFQFGVLAVHQRVDDGRVGGRTTDAIFFQRLHERSFGVARRWLREMLFRADGLERRYIAYGQQRQAAARFFRVIVAVVFVNTQEPGLQQRATASAQACQRGVLRGDEFDRHLLEQGRCHLRSHRALPDEVVEAPHVVVDGTLQFFRRNGGIRWADAFVGFLRIRLLGLELARCVGEAFCTVEVVDGAADGGDGFVRQ